MKQCSPDVRSRTNHRCHSWEGVTSELGGKRDGLVVPVVAERARSEGEGRSGQVPFLLAERAQ